MVQSDNNEDIGYHDLLFNSAVACILLFIIFSVKVGGSAAASSVGSASGTMSSAYSIIPSEKTGEMITLRMVSISGLSNATIKEMKEMLLNDDRLTSWEVSAEPFADSSIPREQVYFNNGTAIFSVALAKLNSPNVQFTLNPEVISLSNGPVKVKGLVIEGASSLELGREFKGIIESQPKDVNPQNIRVSFRVTGPTALENSITIH
ncbi:hypothetical protein [uncultured Roseivirga sp.]|uniref:hypothetical protein n=1 Tax=uncultured Roseivirga sp. TaxID=543088 RepID=UPI0030DA2F76|tara:strand:+ start:4542 stop:5159 length:618 start_codon:yes stop_codon:yes gene_type:complete